MRRAWRAIMRAGRWTINVGKAVSRRVSGIGLFWSIAAALVLGFVVAVSAQWALHRFIRTSTAEAAPIDVTKLSLTVVAGVGGVVALVVAYRRQRDLEQGRFVERFGAAAAQLGATDVAVRIAGVYAMAGVADESRGLRRQQCIDVLCGYLRLPYDPEQGGSGRTKRVVTTPTARPADDLDPGKVEEHQEYRQNDREVRATIVRVIAAHLRPTAEYSWSACDFDFRTAYLEDANFNATTFSGVGRFDGATFSGITRFDGATFSSDAEFAGATFSRTAWFNDTTFSSDAWFNDTIFSSDAWFANATFSSTAWFADATFSGDAQFRDVEFFDGAEFAETKFSGDAQFDDVVFFSYAWFNDAMFSSTASFRSGKFLDGAEFTEATFSGDARFDSTRFSSKAEFDHVAFSGLTSFRNVNFGGDRVSFAEPRRWGPPEPVFDWSTDAVRKPPNVEPVDWPPGSVTPPSTSAE